MPSSEQEANARDGTRLVYTLYDHPAPSHRVALIHSLAMDRSFWRPVAERLAANASVLTHDCRGHGRSDKPAGPVTVERHADDLADLLDRLGWKTALVAGASMGGCIALAFAIRHPGRDRFRAEHPQVVKDCVDAFLRNDVAAYAQTCRMLGACDLRAGLPSIKVPTAIVVGEEDYATPPAMAEAMHKAIAGSTLTVLPGARHLTPLERPDEVAAALEKLPQRARVRRSFRFNVPMSSLRRHALAKAGAGTHTPCPIEGLP